MCIFKFGVNCPFNCSFICHNLYLSLKSKWNCIYHLYILQEFCIIWCSCLAIGLVKMQCFLYFVTVVHIPKQICPKIKTPQGVNLEAFRSSEDLRPPGRWPLWRVSQCEMSKKILKWPKMTWFIQCFRCQLSCGMNIFDLLWSKEKTLYINSVSR